MQAGAFNIFAFLYFRVHCTNKIYVANQINHAANIMLTNSQRNFIPCLVPTHTKLFTPFRRENGSKAIPRPAAHPLQTI